MHSIFHAELFAVSGAGGHSWRAKKSRAAQAGFQPAERGGVETRRRLGIRRGADLRDDAERAERPRLFNEGTGKTLCGAKRRRHSRRGLRGFRGGKRAEAGVEISAGASWRGPSRRRIRCASSASVISSGTRTSSPRCTKSATATTSMASARSRPKRRWAICHITARISKKSSPRASGWRRELTKLGFRVFPSQTNFILAQPPRFAAHEWQHKLRERKILVRWFNFPEVKNYLRITIGTPAEVEALVKAARKILVVDVSHRLMTRRCGARTTMSANPCATNADKLSARHAAKPFVSRRRNFC